MQPLFPLNDAYKAAPQNDEIEVTVIGPGFGEAIAVHTGDGFWILVDSCVGKGDPSPATLRYLADIGADLGCVRLIVVSHWDDDHCKGMAQLAKACPNARVAMSKSFIEKDFLAFVATYRSPLVRNSRSGVKEIRDLLEELKISGRSNIISAATDRQIFSSDFLAASHGQPMAVWTLSPSDDEMDGFLAWVASCMPSVGETRRVARSRKRNNLSTVVYIAIGNDAIILGGDLEEEGNAKTGWSAILTSTGRPSAKANLFKLAHHGSHTGDHSNIWAALLAADPTAIIAPFRNGNVSLPTATDVARTMGYTSLGYVSTDLRSLTSPSYERAVQKTIGQVTKSFTTIKPAMGIVRCRRKATPNAAWAVELFGNAKELANIR